MQMQTSVLKQKLQRLVKDKIKLSSSSNQLSNQSVKQYYSSLIKNELSQYLQFTNKQIIKLSAYYQTKLQYQSLDYQEEINILKQEIQRQYKVIGLMKLQLEDLVVLLNQQRNQQPPNSFRKLNNQQTINQQYMKQSIQNKNEQTLRMQLLSLKNQLNHRNQMNMNQHNLINQEQYKQWRVKKTQNNKYYQIKNQNNTNYSKSMPTISGLQIITQQQTQRTLVSVCDQEQTEPINVDFQQYDREFNQINYKSSQLNQQNQNNKLKQNQNQIQPNQQSSIKKLTIQQSQQQTTQYNPQNNTKSNNHMLIEEQTNQQSKQRQYNQPNFLSYQQKPLFQQIYYPPNKLNKISFNKKIKSQNQQQNSNNKPQTLNNNFFNQSNQQHNQIQSQQEQQQTQPNFGLFNNQPPNSNNKPTIYYRQLTSPQQSKHNQSHKSKTNFVQNPFSKKKTSNPVIKTTYHQNQSQNIQTNNAQTIKWEANQSNKIVQNQHQSKFFLQQFRRSFVQNYYQSQKSQIKKSSHQNSVMSILQMIALNNDNLSKKSQRSNKKTSKSKSKGKKQNKTNTQIKSSKQKKLPSSQKKSSKNYHHQTEEYNQSDQQGNSRISMIRYPTSQDINHSQRYNPTSFDQTSCYTSNDFRHNYGQNSDIRELKSLHTTFGRPTSFEYMNEPLSNNINKLNVAEMYLNQRKGSMKSKKQGPSAKDKQNIINKQNQRYRRMSQKLPSNKSNLVHSIINKKIISSSKFIKPQNLPIQQSVQSMIQSHLQNNNKFLVGTKKQQAKYDGQRISVGSQAIRHGHGILFYSNGLIYEGEFINNKRHGYGLLKFNHVELYSGEWKQDELQGKGKIRNCTIINKKKKQASENNSTNNNSLLNNLFTKWISYCGQFKSNRFEGQGTLYLQGGQRFIGLFRNGVADGQGCLYRKNGQVQSGIWRNNILVQRIETAWT